MDVVQKELGPYQREIQRRGTLADLTAEEYRALLQQEPLTDEQKKIDIAGRLDAQETVQTIQEYRALMKQRREMSYENQSETKQSWIGQLQKIKSMLSEGHTLMAQIIGPYLKDAEAVTDPDSYSDRMDLELDQVGRDVRNLVDAIANIHDKF